MATTEQAYDSHRKVFGLRGDSTQLFHGEADTGGTTREKSARWPRLARISRHEWTIALLYFFLDVLTWVLIYDLIGYLRRDSFYVSSLQFFLMDVIQLAVIVTGFYIIGGYDRHIEKRSLSYTAEHILALAAAAIVSAGLIYSAAAFDQTMKPSRGVLLLSFIMFTPISLGYRRFVHRFVAASTANKTFLVIGSGESAARFYESYKASPNQQRLHFVDLGGDHVGKTIAGEGTPIIEGDLEAKLSDPQTPYSGIILAEKMQHFPLQLLERLVRTQFQRTRVYTLESFYESQWRYVPLDAIDPVWPLQTGFQLARISPYHYLKRLFDLTMSMVAFTLAAPLFGLIALVIWLANGRPIVYKQRRIGREGQPFTVYKFRTMVHHSDKETDDIYTREKDPRVTGVGRWLRKLRLDELPQLWNVLNGEMSLIGPRAEWVKCAERYENAIPFYHFRHLVKPGITGWAQVNYPYGESDEDAIEKLKYDLYYIRHYSLKLDAMIALKTVYVMLFSKGR